MKMKKSQKELNFAIDKLHDDHFSVLDPAYSDEQANDVCDAKNKKSTVFTTNKISIVCQNNTNPTKTLHDVKAKIWVDLQNLVHKNLFLQSSQEVHGDKSPIFGA